MGPRPRQSLSEPEEGEPLGAARNGGTTDPLRSPRQLCCGALRRAEASTVFPRCERAREGLRTSARKRFAPLRSPPGAPAQRLRDRLCLLSPGRL